ncbi:MAG TPA: VOC family protein [Acidimicrobiia bacterium]|nr:VOC family protein [Acidimicrobiia bacterium]
MPFHHVAIATTDLEATHRFYTEAMGFRLVKGDAVATLEQTGWAKHLFYDTGNGELFAVWELHDDTLPEFDPAISRGLGLPTWVNHLAFGAPDLDTIEARKQRLLEHGHDVVEVDHGWCYSIYANDPNGTMVEFCCSTRALTDADADDAARLLGADAPELGPPPAYYAAHEAATARVS